MKITLTNFKCWENKSFTLPDNGICLLNGKSGKGKSSLLNAIVYCITGDGGRYATTFSKKHTKVAIEIDNFKITRSKGPSSLFVEDKHTKKIYENDEAQAFINRIFGSEFSNTSYIDQENVNSFVFLSPSEKMEFLEKLLLHQYNIDDIKTKIKEDMSKTKNSYTSFEAKISTLQDIIKKMVFKEEKDVFVEKIKLSEDNYEKTIKTLKTNLETSEKNLKTVSQKIKKYEEKYRLNRESLMTYNNLKELKEQSEKEIYDMSEIDNTQLSVLEERKQKYLDNKQIFQLKEKLCYLQQTYDDLSKKNREEIEVNKSILSDISFTENKYISSLNEFERHLLKIYEIDDKMGNEIDYDKLIETERENLKSMKENEQSLQQTIHDLEKCYTCPSCHKTLQINSQKLIVYERKEIKENIDELKSKLSSIKKDIQTSDKKINDLCKQKTIYDSLLSEYNQLYDKMEKIQSNYPFEQDLDWISSKREEVETNNKKFTDISKKINDLENDKYQIQLKKEIDYFLEISAKTYDNLYDIPTEEEYLSLLDKISVLKEKLVQKNKLTQSILSLEKKIKEIHLEEDDKDYESLIETEVEKQTQYETKIELYKTHISNAEEWLKIFTENKQYTEMEDAIESSQVEKDYLNDRMRCLVKLRDHIKYTEKKCIDDFIDSLNAHASIYIDHFFQDEDISVCLKTTQETKDKKEKTSLNFNVQYKNLSGDLKFLSGGERDRVNLAFTLAFAELVQNKILLLDECISSLDAETTNIVLEHIKERYKGSMVLLVSHQANLGFFDHIIQV